MPTIKSYEQREREQEVQGSPYAIDLGTVSGIPIRLHFTFLLLLLYFAVTGSGPGRWHRLIFVMIMFGCVVLHELGHSIVAQRYGVEVSEIVLYPIGGVARLESMPKPQQEFWIALAGPAVNVVIAAAIYSYLGVRSSGSSPIIFYFANNRWWEILLTFNLVMIAFNMLPAFPMDGGRVLRSVLAMKIGEYRATQIAATIGQLLAFIFAAVGLFSQNWPLLFIAFFVYIGAGQEATIVRGRTLLHGTTAKDAMLTEYHTLPSGATLGEARDLLLKTSQTDFPIMNGEEVIGLLSRSDLLAGLARENEYSYVAGCMSREFETATQDEGLEEIAMDMQQNNIGTILVVEEQKLIGMITKENVGELMMVRQVMYGKNG